MRRYHQLAWGMTLMVIVAAFADEPSTAEPKTTDSAHENNAYELPKVLQSLATIIPALAEKRVVFIGESHDRFDHHLNQLAVIKRLHEQNPHWVIGLEFFQQPYQEYLDAYIAGAIDERTFLEKTEYFERWRFDYRLYRPILQYAQEQGIPLLALNIPNEISRKVGRSGLAALTEQERVWVPETIDKSDLEYRERLKKVFEEHAGFDEGNFENFLEAQLLWDEAMAQRAAEYLKEHPSQSMIILAGSGHLAYGSGIPQRLQRRLEAEAATALLLQNDTEDTDQRGADYVLMTNNRELPPAGRIGVMLEVADEGMNIQGIIPESAAQSAGLQTNDKIIAIDEQPVQSMQDVRLAMLDRVPGQTITVMIKRMIDKTQNQLSLRITLQ